MIGALQRALQIAVHAFAFVEAIKSPDFEVWPQISEQKDGLPDADDFANTEDKLADFDPAPGG